MAMWKLRSSNRNADSARGTLSSPKANAGRVLNWTRAAARSDVAGSTEGPARFQRSRSRTDRRTARGFDAPPPTQPPAPPPPPTHPLLGYARNLVDEGGPITLHRGNKLAITRWDARPEGGPIPRARPGASPSNTHRQSPPSPIHRPIYLRVRKSLRHFGLGVVRRWPEKSGTPDRYE